GRGVATAVGVGGGHHQKRRQRYERARMFFQPRQLLFYRAFHGLAVDFADLGYVLDNVHPRLLSQSAPSMHQRSINLQAEKRAMGVVVAREERSEGGRIVRFTIDNQAKYNTLNRALMV